MYDFADGRSLEQLAIEIQEDPAQLKLWLTEIPKGHNYRSFSIPKRNGGRRPIESPNDLLKDLQTRIFKKLLRYQAIQTVATGFVQDRSILDNVRPHVNSQIVIKIDLRDFFGSIKHSAVYRYWVGAGWTTEAATILANICCKEGRLPQGAPTSPALSNLVNRQLDGYLEKIAKRYRAEYTRYADDLTFSFSRKNMKAESDHIRLLKDVRELIERENYEVQWRKGIKILRSHQRQIVTGLVINEKPCFPRYTRNLIRALKYQHSLGNLSELDEKRLDGYLRLLQMIEKDSNPQKHIKSKSAEINSTTSSRQETYSTIKVAGDLVVGNQTKTNNNLGGNQNFGELNLAAPTTDKKSWTRDHKIAVIVGIISIIIAIIIGLSAIFVPEIRTLLGFPNTPNIQS